MNSVPLLVLAWQGAQKQNDFYLEWAFLAFLAAAIAGVFQAGKWFFTSKHRDLESALLSLEQVASAAFVGLVLREARRVFAIVDDRLTEALSQEQASVPAESRFDRFCRALRAIPEEELGPTGRYTDVIRESFSRIISEVASRLLGAMDSHGVSTGNPVLNPTGIRYSLERDGYLGFSEVSRFDSKSRGMEKLFRRVWLASGVLPFLVGACSLVALVAAFINHADAESVIWWCIWIGIGASLLCALLFCFAFIQKQRIIARSRKHGDPQALVDQTAGGH